MMFDLIPFDKNNKPSRREDLFSQLAQRFFNEDIFAPFAPSVHSLRVDLKETGDAYLIEADLPGIAKEDISLRYANNYLTISANRQETEESRSENYLRRERRCGTVQRSFYINNVQDDKITAAFKDGVLRITLPKQDPTAAASHSIPIN
ncbi:MAG: heat shock protein Hsp18 [Sporomusaceae bacterium]|nr:heat shock protein Hsp18 [Sporomusaceae bacterium]